MSTFIVRTDVGAGTRVAIKDLIDVQGLPTTAGCRALEQTAPPAAADAECLTEIRRQATAGTVRLVGKTNLHELAYGTTGRNPWFGTPRNPLDPNLIPGGSSSGSAVAVAAGDADIAIGSDTGGSVRIPAGCCGIVGLKTTWGRISTRGTWPLAPSLDTIGPMARDVTGVIDGMRLLLPEFRPATVDEADVRILRMNVPADPEIDRAVDAALASFGAPVERIEVPDFEQSWSYADVVLSAEAWRADRDLLEQHPAGISDQIASRIRGGAHITTAQESSARAAGESWRQRLDRLLSSAPAAVIALPTLTDFPPPLDARRFAGNRLTMPFNFSGMPALALPLPSRGPVPASLQIVGPGDGEELLVALGRLIESAVGSFD